MRSRVVLDHLVTQGHDVHVMASQRAVDYLAQRFSSVHRIHGMHIVYEENRVRRGKTLLSNAIDAAKSIPGQIRAYFELIAEFRPDVVVSDFESWTYVYAKLHGVPVLSVDNIQMINRCTHDPTILNVDRAGFEVARAFVKGKLPHADHYLISTFYYPEIRKPRTSLHPPILRPEILAAERREGGHLLVYQTAEGNDALASALAASGLECRIYGMRRSLRDEQVEGNLRYQPFSEAGFIADLASCRAVVAGGGFTLMSESVYLHKPMLAVPLVGQFEQLLNALYLQRLGYGRYARVVDQETLSGFLSAVPECAERLSHYEQDGNRQLLAALDGHLDVAAARL
jgi:uncharacterized protein (TIGR00661 family)